MKTFRVVCLTAIAVFVMISVVLANPAMLPQHPGYPMANSVDPVNGQSLANDPGQKNATAQEALVDASRFDDPHSKQNLSINEDNQRIVERPGAGILPKVQGPHIRIEPPVKEGTKVIVVPK